MALVGRSREVRGQCGAMELKEFPLFVPSTYGSFEISHVRCVATPERSALEKGSHSG